MEHKLPLQIGDGGDTVGTGSFCASRAGPRFDAQMKEQFIAREVCLYAPEYGFVRTPPRFSPHGVGEVLHLERDHGLALGAKAGDGEGEHVAGLEPNGFGLHAEGDAGGGAGGDDVAGF